MRFGIHTLDEYKLQGKTVLCRVDMNQPVDRATDTLKSIQRITPRGPVFKNSVLGEDGRPVGVEGEEELVPADTTIIAINQRPKDKLVRTTHGLNATERGLLIVDENSMTTREGVFAAGDVVHGSLTVVHAVRDARNAAEAMMRYMEQSNPQDP